MLFGGAVRIGQVIVDSNGEITWCKDTFLERILMIKV
jgi:hypothetical protein